MSDLEAHLNAPFEHFVRMDLLYWVRDNHNDHHYDKMKAALDDYWNSKKSQERYRQITQILGDHKRAQNRPYALKFQKVRPVIEESGLYVPTVQLKEFEKQAQAESEKPAVLALNNAPDDVDALRAQLAANPAAPTDNPFMLALLAAGQREPRMIEAATNAGLPGRGTASKGPRIEEVD